MKKTFPVNINGTIFYIDEDAYELLNTYLDQLRRAFPGEEGAETVNDIESRISEIFAAKCAEEQNIIVLADVNSIIERMGRPDDITGQPCDNTHSTGRHNDNVEPSQYTPVQPVVKKLYRDERNKIFGGVLAGLALYTGWNVTVMRILLVILALCTKLLPLVLVYLIAWMLIPAARTPRQILEMTGSPVTVGNVGQTILGTADTASQYYNGDTTNIGSVIGRVLMGMLGFIGGCIALAMVILLIYAVAGLILLSGWHDAGLLSDISGQFTDSYPALTCWALTTLSLAVLIPSVGAVWAGCNALFNTGSPSRGSIITLVIIEAILVTATIILMRLATSTDIISFCTAISGAAVTVNCC